MMPPAEVYTSTLREKSVGLTKDIYKITQTKNM